MSDEDNGGCGESIYLLIVFVLITMLLSAMF